VKASVVLPTYNEAENIVALVKDVHAHIPQEWEREIIVVDDNSPDGTLETAREAFKENSDVVLILRTEDRGLAKSLRAGLERATGDRVIAMGADFTHDPSDIPKMLQVSGAYDIVVGSRFCAGGNMHSTIHYIASLYYNRVIRVLLRTQVQDNLGGYFVMSREKLNQLPFDRIFYGYGDFFFRLLYHAQKRGFTIVEVPAYYNARRAGRSKSNFGKLLLSYTVAVLKLVIERLRARAFGGRAQ
jgi:dolichol-phosphate mannosyltransferase